MNTKYHPRNLHDLGYDRNELLPWLKGENSRGRQARLKALNERRTLLNRMSKAFCEVFQRTHALIAYISFTTHRLHAAAHRLRVAAGIVTPRPVKRVLSPARPDSEFEDKLIQAQINTASHDFSARILINNLKQISRLVMQINSGSSSSTSQKPEIFYRVTHSTSHTLYDDTLGFCCARWLWDHDFSEESREDFCAHVGGEEDFESPYISLTDDPGRAFRFGQPYSEPSVSIIDAAKLRQMEIQIERTTDLARRWGVKYKSEDRSRVQYVTDSHWLARFWIPAECIILRVPFYDFKKVCIKYGVVDGNTNVARFGKAFPPVAFEEMRILAEAERSEPKKSVPAKFADEDDEEEEALERKTHTPSRTEKTPPSNPSEKNSESLEVSTARLFADDDSDNEVLDEKTQALSMS